MPSEGDIVLPHPAEAEEVRVVASISQLESLFEVSEVPQARVQQRRRKIGKKAQSFEEECARVDMHST